MRFVGVDVADDDATVETSPGKIDLCIATNSRNTEFNNRLRATAVIELVPFQRHAFRRITLQRHRFLDYYYYYY